MDSHSRHVRIARRFLVSVIQQHGSDAPEVLRRWADELEQLEVDTRAEEEWAGFSFVEVTLPGTGARSRR